VIYGAIHCTSEHRLLLTRVARTSNPLERMRGLLGRPPPGHDGALLIDPCRAVHTFGMRYPIDLIYLGNDWTVSSTVSELPPWRMSTDRRAAMVLELAAGAAKRLEIHVGMNLSWKSCA